MWFQQRKPRRKIILSRGDIADSAEGTSLRFLYKIGSILGPKRVKMTIYFIKTGLICLKFGSIIRNHSLLRNFMKIVIYGLNSEIMGQKVAKTGKIGEKRDFLENHQNFSICSPNHLFWLKFAPEL